MVELFEKRTFTFIYIYAYIFFFIEFFHVVSNGVNVS